MKNNIIYKHIRRCNRNLLLINLCMILFLFYLATANYRYLYNCFLGPFPIERDRLFLITDPNKVFKYYVTVYGDESIATGLQQVERRIDKYTKKVKSEKITANYIALKVDERLLIVKTSANYSGTQFTGAIINIPSEVYYRYRIIASEIELKDYFLPYMLDTTDFKTTGYITVFVGVLISFICFYNLIKVKKRFSNSDLHPISISLKNRFGAIEDIVSTIDSELKNSSRNFSIGSTVITDSWLLKSSIFGLELIDLFIEPVWIYKKVTKHYTNFIPTGKSYAVIIQTRHGIGIEISCNNQNGDKILQELLYRCPWLFVGFDNQLQNIWKSNMSEMIKAVDVRRKAILNELKNTDSV